MKKITIIFMSVLMIFASCSTSYDDTNETKEKSNTEIVEDKPSNEENDSENDDVVTEPTENDNDEEGNSENTEIVEDEPSNEEPKEDDSENNAEESSNEENDSENDDVVENETSCKIDENINILELNYIGYYEDSTAIFTSDSNDAELVKTTPFAMRCNISSSNGTFREIVITVSYNEGKLDFSISSQSPYYTIDYVDYSESTSTIHIYILHK